MRILECSSAVEGGHGLLCSTSILANGPLFDECADLLDGRPASLMIGVHLNVVEGHCCSEPSSIPMLVDGDGMFRLGFASMLLASMGPHGHELERELEIEISAQIRRVSERFPELRDHLRLDGHQHFQLIPAMFEAILAVVGREGYHLEYLRVPVEPAAPFLRPRVLFTIKPVNWVKHWVLDFLWRLDRKHLPGYRDVSAAFCGVLFSGSMDSTRVPEVYGELARRAERDGMDLELLFHPGGVASADECLNPSLTGFTAFYLSPGRDAEYHALREMRLETSTSGVTSLS
ncbi:MAG: ChbG/HpnK family deacetylase [Atopobiaceae bacterium]|nr:ChbG/HpnK family deacetylase [Atopobiaceae bacterium]MCI2207883.1 ChbG/HpnK family deacetylase [Atopobiaceae bacterium]